MEIKDVILKDGNGNILFPTTSDERVKLEYEGNAYNLKEFLDTFKQNKTDNSLTTDDKTIVGAINETLIKAVDYSTKSKEWAVLSQSYAETAQGWYKLIPFINHRSDLMGGCFLCEKFDWSKDLFTEKSSNFNQVWEWLLNSYNGVVGSPLLGRVVDFTEYDRIITSNEQDGNCIYWGIDIDNELFRTPHLTNTYECGGGNATGGYLNDGLPNIIGSVTNICGGAGIGGSGAMSGSTQSFGFAAGGSAILYGTTIKIDASKSSSIYGNSEFVQPKTYQGRWVVKLFDSAEEQVSIIKDYEINNTIPLGTPLYSDHKLVDANYIQSANQWNDGLKYTSMYDLLFAEYENALSEVITKIIGSYTITYKKTPLGYLISESDNVELIFNESKVAFWKIDIANNQFKFPQNGKRTLIERKVDGMNWYEVYSDGWCRQGGKTNNVTQNTTVTINFLKPFANVGYNFIQLIEITNSGLWTLTNKYSDSIIVKNNNVSVAMFLGWIAEGYIAVDEKILDPNRYLYYKVSDALVNPNLLDVARMEGDLIKKADNDLSNIQNVSPVAKQTITNWMIPDYTTGVAVATTPYTAPYDCYLIMLLLQNNSVIVRVDGVDVIHAANLGNCGSAFIKAGSVITTQGYTGGYKIYKLTAGV